MPTRFKGIKLAVASLSLWCSYGGAFFLPLLIRQNQPECEPHLFVHFKWARHHIHESFRNPLALWLILRFKHKKSTPHRKNLPTTHHPTIHPPAVVLVAHDVQKGLLLPREGRVRQILRRRWATHREGELLVAARDALPLGLPAGAAREVGLGFTWILHKITQTLEQNGSCWG